MTSPEPEPFLAVSDGQSRVDGLSIFFDPEPARLLVDQVELDGQILDAARRCVLQLGSRMSLNDVANAAGVSRGSVYKYFRNRERLLAAVNDLCFRLFVEDMDRAMSSRHTLSEKIAAAALEVRRWNEASERVRAGGILGEAEVTRVMTRGSEPILRREMEVVRRHLEIARLAGEVRPDLDLSRASEWVVRILHSFSTNPALTFDGSSAAHIEEFVASFAVDGLA